MRSIIIISIFFINLIYSEFSAQVGFNTNDPKTTLDVNGAITTRGINFTISNNFINIDQETSLAIIEGTGTGVITITSYTPQIDGHRLVIFNNTLGGNNAYFDGLIIENGTGLEFIYSNGSWKKITASNNSTNNNNSLITNAADLGILPDGNDYSSLIRSSIEDAAGAPLFFPAGKYIYDGVAIPTNTVNILGIMPILVGDTLEAGTIFLNKLNFSGTHVAVQGLGVQLLSPDDCFRVTPAMNTGKYCRLKDIITVGANTTSPFHSVLLEGLDFVQAENIECYNAYMGQVFKINSGNLTNLRCSNIAKESIFIKSDNVSGNCRNLTLNGIQIENQNAGTATGIKINSAGAQLQNVSISNVNIQKAQFGISILSSGSNGIAINDLNFSNIRIDGTTLKCIYLEANRGFIYKTNFSNMDLTAVGKSLFETVGNVKFVQISNMIADVTGGTSTIEKGKIINFGSTTTYTNIANLNITKGYVEDNTLAVNYDNAANYNRITNYNVGLNGNAPISENTKTYQTITNGTVTLGNLNITIPSSGNNSLQLSLVSGTTTVSGTSTNIYSLTPSNASGIAPSISHWKIIGKTLDQAVSFWESNLNLLEEGDRQEILFKDDASGDNYKIIFIVGESNANHQVSIEKLN